jgi:hypothetical protein
MPPTTTGVGVAMEAGSMTGRTGTVTLLTSGKKRGTPPPAAGISLADDAHDAAGNTETSDSISR